MSNSSPPEDEGHYFDDSYDYMDDWAPMTRKDRRITAQIEREFQENMRKQTMPKPLPEEVRSAFLAALKMLLDEHKCDYTSRFYKKALRVARGGRHVTASKAAQRAGVPLERIDAIRTLLGV